MQRLVWFLLLALVTVASARAAPESVPPSVVAIVDVQRVLQESLAARSVQKQIEAQRSKFQARISAEEAGLREAEKKLAKLRETAQTEAYAVEEQKLRERFLVVERQVQARRKSLDQSFTDAMNKVRTGLVNIVKSVAREKGVTLVVVKQQVIWNDSAIDITDIVLGRLDKNLPEIEVSVPLEKDQETRK